MIPDVLEGSVTVFSAPSTTPEGAVTDTHHEKAIDLAIVPPACPVQPVDQSLVKGSDLILDCLPIEIIQHIGSFLDPRQIVYSLSGSSKRLHQIFHNEDYWRVRIKRKFPSSYPIIPDRIPKPAVWRHRCRDRELHFDLFNNTETKMRKQIFGIGEGGLIGSDVNAVCLGKDGRFLATGGRDRHVILWDMEAVKKTSESGDCNNMDFQRVLHTHGGWVWSLRSKDNLLSSGAWDQTISVADLNHSLGKNGAKTILKSGGSVTCHNWQNNYLVAGTFIGGIELFDPRNGDLPVIKKSQTHHGAVLGIHMEGNQVVVVGSDKKLQVLDIRKNEFVVKKSIPNNDYGTQLCVSDGSVWVGTKRGQVLLYDQYADFEPAEDFTAVIGHSNQITGLNCDPGHILTCAMDRKAKMNQPTKKSDSIWQYQAEAGFTAMDFSKNCDLVLAWGPVIGIWWPI